MVTIRATGGMVSAFGNCFNDLSTDYSKSIPPFFSFVKGFTENIFPFFIFEDLQAFLPNKARSFLLNIPSLQTKAIEV